jgi:hypothetical protein
MPNTLAHIGINAVLTRSLIKKADILLIYLGAIIPDIPWILQRIVSFTLPDLNPYDLRLYCVVQATLFFSLIFSLVLSILLKESFKAFVILMMGVLLHLILDSIETKWANGVHLFAPFNWDLFNAGIFWPENNIVQLLSIFGLIYFSAFWKKSLIALIQLDLKNKRKLSVFLLILISYIFLPIVFLQNAEDADNHFVKTLRNSHEREAKYFEIDRGKYVDSKDGDTFLTPFGETLLVENINLNRSEILSIRAKFIAKNEIQIIEYHIHGNRDIYSYVGLFLICIIVFYRTFLGVISKKVKYSLPI